MYSVSSLHFDIKPYHWRSNRSQVRVSPSQNCNVTRLTTDFVTLSDCGARSTFTADWAQHSLWNMTPSWLEIMNFDHSWLTLALTWFLHTKIKTPCTQTQWPSPTLSSNQWRFLFFEMWHLASLSVVSHASWWFSPASWLQINKWLFVKSHIFYYRKQ